MVSMKSIVSALTALCVVPIAAAPADFEITLASGLQETLASTLCKCGTTTLIDSKPADWVKGFQNLTQQFTELATPTRLINAQNAFFVVANEGPLPDVLKRVVNVIEYANEFLEETYDSKPLDPGKDADDVITAYTGAVAAAVFWSNLLGTKGNDFKGDIYRPVGALGESAIRGVLEVFTSINFEIKDYLPKNSASLEIISAGLDTAFATTIAQYGNIKLGRY